MEVLIEDHMTVLCNACGALAEHHPFVKPRSLTIGLICARCGNVLGTVKRG